MTAAPRFTTSIKAFGSQGNVMVVLANCCRMMKALGTPRSDIEDVKKRVFAAPTTGAALDVIREWFPVDTGERT